MRVKIALSVFVLLFSFPIPGEAKKRDSSKSTTKTFQDFRSQFFYVLTMSDDQPSTVSSCSKIGDSEIKKFSSYKCTETDETTKMFWDWNCEKPPSNSSVSIVLGGEDKCNKAVEDFRARN